MSSSKSNPARERHRVCAQRLRSLRPALGLTRFDVFDVVARLQQRGIPATGRAVRGGYRTRWSDPGSGLPGSGP